MKWMARSRLLLFGSAGVIAGSLLLASVGLLLWVPSAMAQDASICIPIHAVIMSTFVTAGCESPVGLCTTGTITEGGILNGTTEFTALSVATAAGMPGVEPDTTLAYSGLLKITTKLGTLTISDVGIFDTAHGVFSELDRITEGTERFFGSNGTLFIYGTATADGTGFGGSINGDVCLAR